MIKKIHQDDREIEAVYWNDIDGSAITVGQFGYSKIVAYGEPGLHCDISFFAIYKGEEIVSRIPATQVQVQYKGEKS